MFIIWCVELIFWKSNCFDCTFLNWSKGMVASVCCEVWKAKYGWQRPEYGVWPSRLIIITLSDSIPKVPFPYVTRLCDPLFLVGFPQFPRGVNTESIAFYQHSLFPFLIHRLRILTHAGSNNNKQSIHYTRSLHCYTECLTQKSVWYPTMIIVNYSVICICDN